MTTVFSFFEEIEPKEFERATDVTYHGTVWGTRAALARMAPRDRGTIVPPVYQPEIPADAVHWAARHRRREVYVGVPTVHTILGSKLAPWLAERYLARTAVDGQQTETGPTESNRKGNLMKPPAEDPGAHGPFDGMAHSHSVQWWLSRHRGAVAGLLVAGAAAGTAGLVAAHRG